MPATSGTDRRTTADARAPRAAVIGRHFLAELHGCPYDAIASLARVEAAFLRAVRSSGARVLSHAGHQFSPHGATVVVLLAESHASIHTWPEHGYAGVDFFTCGSSMRAEAAIRELAQDLGAAAADVRVVDRGGAS